MTRVSEWLILRSNDPALSTLTGQAVRIVRPLYRDEVDVYRDEVDVEVGPMFLIESVSSGLRQHAFGDELIIPAARP